MSTTTFRTSLKFITVSLIILQINADAIDKSVKQGLSDILDIKIPGVTVRQCSCDEQNQCTEEIKNQVFDCVDTCWSNFEKITKDPKELKECVDSKEVVFNNFVGCIQTNLHACVSDMHGPQIEKHDILKMFDVAEQKIVSQRESILNNPAVKPVRGIVETTLDFGACVKKCFLKKNQKGFCFDRINCQPLITEKRATSTLKRCIKGLDWKKEAASLCDCSVKAGVTQLEKYCPMLRLMSQSKRSRNNH
jgi:hypothetical protein